MTRSPIWSPEGSLLTALQTGLHSRPGPQVPAPILTRRSRRCLARYYPCGRYLCRPLRAPPVLLVTRFGPGSRCVTFCWCIYIAFLSLCSLHSRWRPTHITHRHITSFNSYTYSTRTRAHCMHQSHTSYHFNGSSIICLCILNMCNNPEYVSCAAYNEIIIICTLRRTS